MTPAPCLVCSPVAGVVGSVVAGGAASLCALTLALDVACGMAHIHAKNIVHGDLSAGNVLLASSAPPPEVVGKQRPHSTFGHFAGHDPSPADLAVAKVSRRDVVLTRASRCCTWCSFASTNTCVQGVLPHPPPTHPATRQATQSGINH